MATLYEAIVAGDAEGVARLLQASQVREHLNEPIDGGSFGATALLVAAPRGNREIIDLLLGAGADINQKSHWWAGPFGVMDEAWREPWLPAFLLERGARLEIHHAVRLGMMEDVRRLLDADAALVHARGGDGQLPLHFAQSVEMADLLLGRGADVNARDVDHESTAAQWMVRDRPAVARHLVERGSEADILLCAALGERDRVNRLLDADPAAVRTTVSDQFFPKRDPRSGGTIYIWTLRWYATAHSVAREFGHEGVWQLLMERSPASLRFTVAAESGDETAVRDWLEREPALPSGLTPDERRRLICAAAINNTAGVHLMLDAGWPADVRDGNDVTALHWAGFHGNARMTRDLLARGAPLDIRDREFNALPFGWTVHGSLHGWHRARGDYGEVAAALLAAGSESPTAEPDGSAAVRDAWQKWRRGRE